MESTAEDSAEKTSKDEQAEGCTVGQHWFGRRSQAETDSGAAEAAAGVAVRG